MPFASHKNHIARLGHQAGSLDGLPAVGYGDHFPHLLLIKACQHVVDDVLRLLKTRIIACDDDTVALLHGLLSHERTLALVAIAACPAHRDDFASPLQHAVDGIEHILKGVGRVGIIHNGRESRWRAERFETSADGFHRAESHKGFLLVFTKHDGGAIDGKQVAHVELANELHAHFPPVDVEIHAFKMTLNELRLEIGWLLHGISLYRGASVLHHHQAVLVIRIGDGKRIGRKTVEKEFLGPNVVFESFMIIKVVARDVGEDSAHKVQPSNAVLHNAVAAHLHECVFATSLYHASQQSVERDGVGRGVLSGHSLTVNVIAHGGQQSCLVPQVAKHLVEHSGDGGLSVRASHAHQAQFLRRVAVERGSHLPHRLLRVLHSHVSDSWFRCGWNLLAEHGYSTCGQSFADKVVPVSSSSAHSHKEVARPNKARIYLHTCNVLLAVALHLKDIELLHQFF